MHVAVVCSFLGSVIPLYEHATHSTHNRSVSCLPFGATTNSAAMTFWCTPLLRTFLLGMPLELELLTQGCVPSTLVDLDCVTVKIMRKFMS